MSKTKIVCTIGPSCQSPEILEQMILSGMSAARFNLSHGTYEEHRAAIGTVKSVSEKLNIPVAVMLDTKGPEYRIGHFEQGPVRLAAGDRFIFTAANVPGNSTRVSVSDPRLADVLIPGDRILIEPGHLAFTVTDLQPGDVICRTDTGGVLSDRKTMFFPGKTLNREYLTDRDKRDLLFAVQSGVDFIACSFVSGRQDLSDVKAFLASNGGDAIRLIAKIENSAGIDHLREICAECDGIMIGRGDMGIEMPPENVPGIQKKIISVCRALGKEVITATEMLESMIRYSRPSRAEVSDVANAVYDGTDAMMLSGETATGRYPAAAVKAMESIASAAEEDICCQRTIRGTDLPVRDDTDAIARAAAGLAADTGAKAILVRGPGDALPRALSRFRPAADILVSRPGGVSPALSLSWGVFPVPDEENKTPRVKRGDKVIAVDDTGACCSIRVETIG